MWVTLHYKTGEKLIKEIHSFAELDHEKEIEHLEKIELEAEKEKVIYGERTNQKPIIASIKAHELTNRFPLISIEQSFEQIVHMLTYVLQDELTMYETIMLQHLYYLGDIDSKKPSNSKTVGGLSLKVCEMHQNGNQKLARLTHAFENVIFEKNLK